MGTEKPDNEHGLGKLSLKDLDGEILDFDKNEVFNNLNRAMDILRTEWGVDDLSNNEGVHLRILVEHCIKIEEADNARLDELLAREQQDGTGEFSLDIQKQLHHAGMLAIGNSASEATARWLLEYGIDISTVQECDLIIDETTGKTHKIFYSSELSSREVHAVTLSDDEALKIFKARSAFLRDHESKFTKKVEELKQQGHKISISRRVIEPEIKELLRIRRMEAHLI